MSNLLGLNEDQPNAPIEADAFLAARVVKNGANWFYWIAALSVINSVSFALGSTVTFLAGLGLTIVMDVLANAAIAGGAPEALLLVALAFNFVLCGGFALLAYYAGNGSKAAFIVGTVVYLLDAGIVLLIGDLFSAAFHGFALFFIIRGLLNLRHLQPQPA